MNEVPTISQEICRKALLELERLAFAYQSGKITASQCDKALLTLWNITSGLIPSQDSELICQAQKTITADDSSWQRSIFLGKTMICVLSWSAEENKAILHISNGGRTDLMERCPKGTEAKQIYDQCCQKFSATMKKL